MEFRVPDDIEQISVKTFLRKHCSLSARMLIRLKGVPEGITCEGLPLRVIDTVRGGQVIRIRLPEDSITVAPVSLFVPVVYEDDHLIVFEKPADMPVHPSHDHQRDTLANAAAFLALERQKPYVFRPVNRLDKDTSGLVLVGKNAFAAAFLAGHVSKVYYALCEGIVEETGIIDAPIRLKPGHCIERETAAEGLHAVTKYEVLAHFEERFTYLKVTLRTGRTHQIRVHFSSIGHPLAGDDLYGGHREVFSRQCLHCGELRFLHPATKEEMCFTSSAPFVERFRKE